MSDLICPSTGLACRYDCTGVCGGRSSNSGHGTDNIDYHGPNFLAGARLLAEEHARSFAALFNTGSPGVPSAEVIGRAALDMQLLAERVARLYATHPSHTRPWPKEPPHCPSCDCERLL